MRREICLLVTWSLSVILMWVPGIACAKIVDRIVAKVNSEVITLSEVQEAGLHIFSEIRKEKSGKNLKKELAKKEREILRDMIDKKLQLQEAREAGIRVSQSEVDSAVKEVMNKYGFSPEEFRQILKERGSSIESYRDQVRERIMLERIYTFEVKAKAVPAPEEIEEYYNQHVERFSAPDEVRARHIFIRPEPGDDDPTKILSSKASIILDLLRRGEDFATLAKRYSEGPFAKEGGDLGIVPRGKLHPTLEGVLFNLKEGEVSNVVRNEYGYHIFKVEERRGLKPIPFEQIRDKVVKELGREKETKRYKEWMKELRNKAFIENMYDGADGMASK